MLAVVMFLTMVMSVQCGIMQERPASMSSECSHDEAYHVKTSRCYATGEQGPCGTDAVFLLDDEDVSNTGSCFCNDWSGNKCGGRPGALWSKDLSCYKLFSQGPCASGEWLVKSTEGTKCEQNPCMNYTTTMNESFIFYFNGQCLETETQGFCNHSEIMIFEGFGSGDEAKCFDMNMGACQIRGNVSSIVGPADCKEGQMVSSDGICEDVVTLA